MKKFFTLAFMLATMFVASTTYALSLAHPDDGIYSLQPQCAPDKELSVQNHAGNWGANVIIDNINSGWRKWKIQRIADTDFYSIIAVHSNLSLDVDGARAQDGVNIATWPFLNAKQNQFNENATVMGSTTGICSRLSGHSPRRARTTKLRLRLVPQPTP